jgi:hypothetical protein
MHLEFGVTLFKSVKKVHAENGHGDMGRSLGIVSQLGNH